MRCQAIGVTQSFGGAFVRSDRRDSLDDAHIEDCSKWRCADSSFSSKVSISWIWRPAGKRPISVCMLVWAQASGLDPERWAHLHAIKLLVLQVSVVIVPCMYTDCRIHVNTFIVGDAP